jgi:hypothetical protein
MKEKLKFKILFCLFSIASLIFTSCVKQSDCDCGLTGKFVYLEEPYYTGPEYFKPDTKIVAHFIKDSCVYPIYGYIPKDYRNHDTLDVNVCFDELQLPEYRFEMYVTYSLKCIELKK